MSGATVEAFLALLYSDAELRRRFLRDPLAVALAAGLCQHDAEALERIDRDGLELAAASLACKRERGNR